METKREIIAPRLLLRIATDLEKELSRQSNGTVIADLETQIEGLKLLHNEINEFRLIKSLLQK